VSLGKIYYHRKEGIVEQIKEDRRVKEDMTLK
jgi:hypothetical protein